MNIKFKYFTKYFFFVNLNRLLLLTIGRILRLILLTLLILTQHIRKCLLLGLN
jgi:hypothetical protein